MSFAMPETSSAQALRVTSQVLLGAGAVFTLSGAANCTIYALTRKLVTFDGVASALRRGSASASAGTGVLPSADESTEGED